MKVSIISTDGSKEGDYELPSVFESVVRDDVIKRAVVASQSARYQPKSPYKLAGEQTSAESIGKGRGRARFRRTKSGRSVGAFVTQAVGGHKVHAPKSEKKMAKKINRKERKLAIRSAIAATTSPDLVSGRGHRIDGIDLPIVVPDKFQDVSTAAEAKETLGKIGLQLEMERLEGSRKQRAGKGKLRGRRIRTPKGPLFVVDSFTPVENALSNFPGVDVTRANQINVEALAPGGVPGRLSVWTVTALEEVKRIYG